MPALAGQTAKKTKYPRCWRHEEERHVLFTFLHFNLTDIKKREEKKIPQKWPQAVLESSVFGLHHLANQHNCNRAAACWDFCTPPLWMVNTADISQAVYCQEPSHFSPIRPFPPGAEYICMTKGRFFPSEAISSVPINLCWYVAAVRSRVLSRRLAIERPTRGRIRHPHATAGEYFPPLVSWDFSFSKWFVPPLQMM